jgi:ubiquinol-cytochrome c reductase cytochrome b subunit
MALICLILQIITGLFLAMHYKGDANLAFASIEYISREVEYGWLLRYMHSNGASVFFIVVYLHMLRAIMHGSFFYPRHLLWATGVIIFLLMIATAFFGYVLPWGQMSFRAATVIISLFSAIPFVGPDIVL